jgi:hypothetical protein
MLTCASWCPPMGLDLPVGDKAVKAELHDSMFSDGVTVSLR